MENLLERIRILWVKARLGVPPPLQRSVVSQLHKAKEIGRLMAKPYLPVCQLEGQGKGGPLSVVYVGLSLARPYVMDRIFVGDSVERQVDRIPFWRHKRLGDFPSGDIVIVEATKHLIRRLPHRSAIVLPPYVHHMVDVRGDWQDVRSRFHKSVRKNELRWIRKYGYEYEVSHARQDFDQFCQQMYSPTMDSRHGELVDAMTLSEAYQYFSRGCLFRITRDGDWVSGGICHPQQDVLVADITGVKNADPQLIAEGATAATYYAAIHWANQHGFRAVNFLGTGPYPAMGRFQHKRKWGAAINLPPHLHRRIWIKVRRVTPAVSQFLKDNPLVVVGEDGTLNGLITVDDTHDVTADTLRHWEKSYITPGMSNLLVRSVSSFAQESSDSSHADLVLSIPLNAKPGNGE